MMNRGNTHMAVLAKENYSLLSIDVYLKYKNHSVCGLDMSCFFIFSVFLEIRFL